MVCTSSAGVCTTSALSILRIQPSLILSLLDFKFCRTLEASETYCAACTQRLRFIRLFGLRLREATPTYAYLRGMKSFVCMLTGGCMRLPSGWEDVSDWNQGEEASGCSCFNNISLLEMRSMFHRDSAPKSSPERLHFCSGNPFHANNKASHFILRGPLRCKREWLLH